MFRMNFIYRIFLALFCAVLVACSSQKECDSVVPMGVFLPSHSDPKLAEEIKNAVQLAVMDVNSSASKMKGKPLVAVFKSDNTDMFSTCRDLRAFFASGNIKIFHLALDNQIIPEHKFLNSLGGVFINYMCKYPPITVLNKNSVRIFVNGAQECELMASAINKEKLPEGVDTKIVMLKSDDFVGKSCGDYLYFHIDGRDRKVYCDVYTKNETDFSVFAEQIERLAPKYFFAYTYGTENGAILEALKKYNFGGVFVSNCAYYESAKHEDYFLPECYTVKTAYSLDEVLTEKSRSFRRRYLQTYKKQPLYVAAYAYDSVMLSAQAYNASANEGKMRDYFLGRKFEGAAGEITFDTAGDSTSQLKLVRLK